MANENDNEASIEMELSQVELGLSSTRSYNGRAIFNSIQSALTSIRDRLQASTSNLALQSRLETAELAHSTRVPLHVLREQQQQQQSSQVRRTLTSEPSMRLKDLKQSDGGGRRYSLLEPSSSKRRSQSIVVASRLLVDEAQVESNELELFENSSSLLSVQEGDEKKARLDSNLLSIEVSLEKEPLIADPMDEEPKLPVESTTTAIYSWGTLGEALLHDGNEPKANPTQVSNDSRLGRSPPLQSVSAGVTHTACVTSQGDILACGRNDDGQVDPERREDVILKRPVLCESLLGFQTRFVKVSCGGHHTAALTTNGSVITWGSNKEGQLGHRVTNNAQTLPQTTFCRPKTMILANQVASDVVCGDNFTLVLTTGMSILACGSDIISNHEATTFPALEGIPIASIAAGKKHAVAVTVHGTAFAWGDNSNGCCGRPFPKVLTTPSPIHVETDLVTTNSDKSPFPNWSTWNNRNGTNSGITVANDVAFVNAACGDSHTVLVTKSGRLFFSGSNVHGQCGLPAIDQETLETAQAIHHPAAERQFVTVAAGTSHTLALDNIGDVWFVGDGKHSLECVLRGQQISMIAAGGKQSIAVGYTKQMSFSLHGGVTTSLMENLWEELSSDDKLDHDSDVSQQIEAFLKSPSLLNCFFLKPEEIHRIYTRLVSIEDAETQQAIFSSMERGIIRACEDLYSARMLYPEAVGCLLSYIQFIAPPSSDEI